MRKFKTEQNTYDSDDKEGDLIEKSENLCRRIYTWPTGRVISTQLSHTISGLSPHTLSNRSNMIRIVSSHTRRVFL